MHKTMDETLSRRAALRRPDEASLAPRMADFDGNNAFASDPVLTASLEGALQEETEEELRALGGLLGARPDAQEVARLAVANPPTLRREDFEGRRIDQVEMHPAYHALTNRSVANGLLSSAWEEGEDAHQHCLRAATLFLTAGCERGHLLPLSASHAAVASLVYAPDIEGELFPLIASRRYDRRPLPSEDKEGSLITLAILERIQSDTGTATFGEIGSGDTVRISGEKAFVALPQADFHLVLAVTTEGPTAALVSRYAPENADAVRADALCDFGGLDGQAIATVRFEEARGRLIGEPGRGLQVLRDVRTLTQLDSAVIAAGTVRRQVARAVHALRTRQARGRPMIADPLYTRLAADLALTSAAQTALAIRLAAAFDHAFEHDGHHAVARVLTPAARVFTLKSAIPVAAEARDLIGPAAMARHHPAARAAADLAVLDQWDGSANEAALELVALVSRDRNVLATALQELAGDLGSQNADLIDRTPRAWPRGRRPTPASPAPFADQLAMVGAASAMRRNLPRIVADAFVSARACAAATPPSTRRSTAASTRRPSWSSPSRRTEGESALRKGTVAHRRPAPHPRRRGPAAGARLRRLREPHAPPARTPLRRRLTGGRRGTGCAPHGDRGLFRGRAHRPRRRGDRDQRHSLPACDVGRAAHDPARRDAELRRARRPGSAIRRRAAPWGSPTARTPSPSSCRATA